MRILHFSDIHLPPRLRSVPLRDWLSKRAIGGANLLIGRAAHYVEAFERMAALDRFRKEIEADLVICTGDYTALGTRAELRNARRTVEPLMEAPLGYVHVPGNHDFYVFDVVRGKRWEEAFGDTFPTDQPQHLSDGVWPFVRFLGDDVAVVGVNSARPNRMPWRSSGVIPEVQLQALARILEQESVRERFVFVITHYAPRLADGGPDTRLHGLVNADPFLEICTSVKRGAILCGHVHRRYQVQVDGLNPLIFCAGSTTMAGREGIWVFDVEPDRTLATPGGWQNDSYVLEPDSAVTW